ncbi:MAG: hypothetical protein JW829_12070 [Pirellulales bacterium]|nr:hypothetical protein [Pirellulales bacterium]
MSLLAPIKSALVRWQSWGLLVAILLASFALAVWQYHEYLHERDQVRESLQQQARSIADVLIGGFRGHRNRGVFFMDEVQGSLDRLVETSGILAVAIASSDGEPILSAGKTDLLKTESRSLVGHVWDPTVYRYTQRFQLPPTQGGPFGRPDRGWGGPDRGWGGRGWGNRRAAEMLESADPQQSLAEGGDYSAVLVFDRSQTDARSSNAALLRGTVVAAGMLVLFCLGLAWRVAVRSAARTRLLAAETRHLRDLSQAAAGLAHETRNPLGLIRGWAQRLAQSDLPVSEGEHLDAIIEECDRVTSRINQFLAFARPATPKLESVSLKKILDELTLLLEPDLQAKDVSVIYEAIPPLQTIQADRELLRQVLFNMIQNGVQASNEGGTVEISIRRGQDGMRRIEVADRGDGVPTEAVESLFSPYFTTKPDGTGLGLAIVRQIANTFGWETGYSRRQGGGSIFWLDRIHG